MKKTIMERLSENAQDGARFAAKNGMNIGLTVAAVGAVGIMAVLVGSTHDIASQSTLLSSLQGAMAVGAAGVGMMGSSKLLNSIIDRVAPEWLRKNDQSPLTTLHPGPSSKMELENEIGNLAPTFKDRLAGFALGTPFEALLSVKTLDRAYMHKANELGAS